ncbi:MAG: DUF5752 family protein [Candidatus Woesearchaeota archaeon]
MNNILKVVEGKDSFFIDGKAIKSLQELVEELNIMDDDTFKKYVNEEKNDFANWIRDVFQETELANKIFSIKERKEIINILRNEIERAEIAEKPVKESVSFEFKKTENIVKDENQEEKKEKTNIENKEKKEEVQENNESVASSSTRSLTTENLPKTKKPLIYFIIGFLLGLLLGVGGVVFYLYKFKGIKLF